jgi:murein DD-endopeptidase MepM/ murein hydrolase activator NlpD
MNAMSRLLCHITALAFAGVLACAQPAASLAVEAAPGQGAEASSTTASTSEQTSTAAAPGPTSTQVEPAGGASSPTGEGQIPQPSPEGEPAPPQIQSEQPQGASASGAARSRHAHARKSTSAAPAAAGAGVPRNRRKAPLPSTLTPALPFSLSSPFGGLPSFFIESFQVPPFLLPIFQAAGAAYGVPWQVLAAINQVETDYGRDLSVSSAGAEGWMQFLPSEWTQYGVDANGDGWADPYNPADAIFTSPRHLRPADVAHDIKAAVYAYNHSQAYVESVMLRAQLLGGTPSELLGAITGLTEARFPVYAPSHFSDGFPTVSTPGGGSKTLAGTTIYTQAGAPVIAVQDGEVAQVGQSPSLGRYVILRDAYGNSYVYAELGEVASEYPVLAPRVHSTVSSRIDGPGAGHEPAPTGPATAGAQPRSPLSEGAAISGLALGAAAGLEAAPATLPAARTTRLAAASRRPRGAKRTRRLRSFAAGEDEVYLHQLVPGVQVIAGTVLGHVGAATPVQGQAGASSPPHIVFQLRPAGAGAPLIDPKPILDGWVALEDTSIFRAKGENPFLATSPTVGQVLLESKQQLEPQLLHGSGVRLGRCARQDVQEGRVDKRVLAMLEYLSVSGLNPTVAGLPCSAPGAAAAANASAGDTSYAVAITAVNGIPIAGHEGPGSIADETVRKLLMLQGLSRPRRIVSLMSYPGAAAAVSSAKGANAIHVAFAKPSRASAASATGSGLTPSQWVELIDRLGEIPDPTVGSGHSSAATSVSPTAAQGEAGGND